MEERAWWKESVIYQIYPRSFKDSNGDGIGDLPGITEKLDYIKELGANIIWLCPIYRSPNDDNGYDISDYQGIMEEFGTMQDFDLLLKEAHARGLKIVMDLVVNHTSDEHVWFTQSRKSKENPYRDYYIWRPGKEGGEPSDITSSFSGSAWRFDEQTGEYFLHMFSTKQPDLNWENPKLRESIYSMMAWWLDKGIDGFRMDVINMISKSEAFLEQGRGMACNGPHVHYYLQEMNRRVLSHYDIMTVGETPNVTPQEAALYAGKDTGELNMVFQFELMDIDGGEFGKWNEKRPDLSDIKRVLTRWQKGLAGKAWNSLYWNNHDQPRAVSRFGDTSTPLYWEKSAKMLATCLHMLQGTPYIYQGEELGMTNVSFAELSQYRDIETLNAYREYVDEKKQFTPDQMLRNIYKASRDNARTPMQWDDSIHAGFSTGQPWIEENPNYTSINAANQVGDPNSIFSYYQRLIRLRRENICIVYGTYEQLMEEDEAIYAYTRTHSEESLLVLCNFTDAERAFSIPESFEGQKQLLIGNYSDSGREDLLRPYEARVYRKSENN